MDPAVPRIQLLDALVARGDIAARGAILLLVNSDDPELRAAAVRALGPLGSIDEVDLLIARLLAQNREEARAAADALSTLPQIEVDIELLRLFRTFEEPPASELAGILARRGIEAAVPYMLQATLRTDRVGRQSIRALATLAEPKDAPELIALLDLVPSGYRRGVEQATAAAMKRSVERPPSLTPVLGSYRTTGSENRISLLRIAAEVGGPEAAAKLTEVFLNGSPEEQEATVEIVLTWPDPDNLDLRLLMAQNALDPTLHTRLVQSCLDQVEKWHHWQADRATLLLVSLQPLVVTAEEKNRLIESALSVQTIGSLEVIQSLVPDPEVGIQATEAAEELTAALDEE
jgi:hypothetical protein